MSDRLVLAMGNLPFSAEHWDRLKQAVNPDRLVVVAPDDEAGLTQRWRQQRSPSCPVTSTSATLPRRGSSGCTVTMPD